MCDTPLKVLMQLDIEQFIVQVIILIPTAVAGGFVGEDAVEPGEPHIYQSFYNYLLYRSFMRYALLFLSI